MINITKEKLADLLNKAFEEGMYGYQDLKESFVEKLVEDCIQETEVAQKKTDQSTFPALHAASPSSDVHISSIGSPNRNSDVFVAPSRISDYRNIDINWDDGYPLITGTWSPQITNSYITNTDVNITNNTTLSDLSFRQLEFSMERLPNEIPVVFPPEGFRITT